MSHFHENLWDGLRWGISPPTDSGGLSLRNRVTEGEYDADVAAGSPVWVGGEVGHALSLDGSNDYFTITDGADQLSDLNGSEWSVSMWAWIPTHVNFDGLVIFNNAGIVMDYNDSVAIIESGNVTEFSAAHPLSEWFHLAAIADASDPAIYINGVRSISSSSDGGYGRGGVYEIGRGFGNALCEFAFSDILIYERILKVEEVHQLRGLGPGGWLQSYSLPLGLMPAEAVVGVGFPFQRYYGGAGVI